MKKATSISYSQVAALTAAVVEVITLLDLSTAPHLAVANDLSLQKVVEPSANHSLDDLTVLVGMSVIVLVDGMTEEEEDTVDMVVFAHPSQIVSAVPVALGDPKFSADELTVNTYTSNKKIEEDPPMNALVVYEPDYAKPDPEGETAGAIVLALTNGEEPNAKPKLEPEDEEMLSEATPREIPDPSVATFAVPSQVLYSSSGDASDDDVEYDQCGIRRSRSLPQIYVSKRQNNGSDELEESLSFVTEDAVDERNPAKMSRKKKKKKTKRRDSSSNSEEEVLRRE
eukprot:scaffold36354_cov144-Skeletonema_dohrnii-CCMP3373.AAC.1